MDSSNIIVITPSANFDIQDLHSSIPWQLTCVYGPQGGLEKKMFIREIKQLKQGALPA
jgi:hypothetical protein